MTSKSNGSNNNNNTSVYEVLEECYSGVYKDTPVCFHWVRQSYGSPAMLYSGHQISQWQWKYGPDRDHFANLKEPAKECNRWSVDFDNGKTIETIHAARPKRKMIFAVSTPELFMTKSLTLQECVDECSSFIGADCWRVAVVDSNYHEPVNVYLDSNASSPVDELGRNGDIFDWKAVEQRIEQILSSLNVDEMLYISLGCNIDVWVTKTETGLFNITEVDRYCNCV